MSEFLSNIFKRKTIKKWYKSYYFSGFFFCFTFLKGGLLTYIGYIRHLCLCSETLPESVACRGNIVYIYILITNSYQRGERGFLRGRNSLQELRAYTFLFFLIFFFSHTNNTGYFVCVNKYPNIKGTLICLFLIYGFVSTKINCGWCLCVGSL